MEVQTTADSVNMGRTLEFPRTVFQREAESLCELYEAQNDCNSDETTNCLPTESDNSTNSSSSPYPFRTSSRQGLSALGHHEMMSVDSTESKDIVTETESGLIVKQPVCAIVCSEAVANPQPDKGDQCSCDLPSPNGEIQDKLVIEELGCIDSRRQRRNSKRKRDSERCCPICGITVRLPELESHFAQEVEKLGKISKSLKKPRRGESGANKSLEQVQHNREKRLTAEVARYKLRARNEIQCPICNLKMSGTQEEVNKHVLQCLKHGENSDTDDELVVDDEESFEEYEFADQTRTRAISFVPGGYRALHGELTRQKTNEDEDLNVDVDDTLAYGQSQYTELDVIPSPISEREDKEREQLRKAVVMDPTAQPLILESRKWSNCEDAVSDERKIPKTEASDPRQDAEGNENVPKSGSADQETTKFQSYHVVSSLKEKIKDLEEQNRSVKCLICMDTYTKPVVSTTCWHVYCEECWLMTMGMKKLCPQCNMIVFPSDLRRIYL